MQRRVAITGCGIVSSIGNSCGEVLDALRNNTSGVAYVPEWGDLGFRSRVAGTIKELPTDEMREKIGPNARYMDLSALYATLSAIEAVSDSGLDSEDLSSDRTGCIAGSGISNTEPIFQGGAKLFYENGTVTPYEILRVMGSTCSANLVQFYGILGRSFSISSACATSLHCIGHGYELIRNGICDIVLAGGAEEVSAILASLFDRMRTVLSTSFNDMPERASRPYDRKRDGFVISGGGGIIVLEEFERAKKRSADIYGEILGFGASSDGHDIIQPHPEGAGAARCIEEALRTAECPVDSIDYVNTHGTGTSAGDIAEALAIRRVFNKKVPMSSTKSLSGHGIGASGVQELIYSLLMMKYGFMAASVNIDDLDPAFDCQDIVLENREAVLNRILTNSFGFGGTNASMVIGNI